MTDVDTYPYSSNCMALFILTQLFQKKGKGVKDGGLFHAIASKFVKSRRAILDFLLLVVQVATSWCFRIVLM